MNADEFAAVIHGLIARAIAPVSARVAALESSGGGDLGTVRERIAVLETKGMMPGPAGANGADGLGFEDLIIEHDGERGFVFKLAQGERIREVARVSIPLMIYRGVYAPGVPYEPGDVVTYGGSMWHCGKATSSRPESAEGAGFWRLAVKRGDKGKSAPGSEVIARG